MATSFQPPPRTRAAHTAHETRDANAKFILGIVALLFLSGVAMHFVLGGLLSYFNHKSAPTDAWRPPQTAARSSWKPPLPRLQVSPPADLQAFQAREAEQLTNYGWVDRTAGIVRVPVERAMELVLAKGLPVRTQTNGHSVGPSEYQLIQQRSAHRANEIQGEP